MANLDNFNADEYKDEYQPLPAGTYQAVITNSEMKPTKKGGEYLSLTIEIIAGQYKGRKVFDNLNMKNANPETEKIARIQLANICRCVGIINIRDSSELHNKPLQVRLAIKPETPEYPAGNQVKGWEPMGGTVAPVSAPEPESTGNKKPWEK